MSNLSEQIFKKSSITYYYSSLFFPKDVRGDIFDLYAFVRTVDNLVDTKPQKIDEFFLFIKNYKKSIKTGNKSKNDIINNFVLLIKKHNLKLEWVNAFTKAMEKDIKKVRMQSLANTLEYMYGSAEVIGLMIAKILKLPKKSYKYAKMLGRAMQYANMIRDIDEDNSLGRTYIPINHIKKHGLASLNKEDVLKNKEKFEKLIRYEIKLCRKWQVEAEKGFAYIPKRLLIPIRTSSDMYKWFTNEIYKNPLIIFQKKIKPSKTRIIMTAAKNAISLIGNK